MNTMVILGAGATKALNHDRIPQMADYFPKCAKFAKESGNDVISLALAACDYERCFSKSNAESENWAAMYFAHSDNEEKKPIYRDNYLDSLMRRFEAHGENLEIVMENAYSPDKEGDARTRLLFLINNYFEQLYKDSVLKEKSCEFISNLFAKIYPSYEDVLTIVNFNYDLFWDSAIWKHLGETNSEYKTIAAGQRLYASDGVINKYIRISDTKSFFTNPKAKPGYGETPSAASDIPVGRFAQWPHISLIKPHGSLNWFYNDQVDDIVLLLSDDERNYGHSKTYEFRTIDYTGKDRFPRWVPLIIPPMNIKIRSHPLFFFQDRRFRERLQDAERVVIIGWSMPPTDLSYSSFIERQVELRLKQLNELIIIDPCGEVNKLFNKFEALFRPRRLKPINKGFGLESIRECLN